MAYKIRYGPDHPARKSSFPLRTAVSVGIFAAWLLMQWFWPEGGELLRERVAGGPETELERATAVFAAEIWRGRGWRYGITAFAAELLS